MGLNGRKHTGPAILLVLCVSVPGCGTMPKDALRLGPETLQQRQLQTRRYQGLSEAELLAASAGVLQDLGFNLEESETELGLVVAAKDRKATKASQVAVLVAVTALYGTTPGGLFVGAYLWGKMDDKQKIRVSLVVRPEVKGAENSYLVRVTLQRLVWTKMNKISKRETLRDPKIYQLFFERLSKAVFLEAQRI